MKWQVGQIVKVVRPRPMWSALHVGDTVKIICVRSSTGKSTRLLDVINLTDGLGWTIEETDVMPLKSDRHTALQLKVKRLDPEAVLPTKAYSTDAAFDITAIDDGKDCYPADAPGDAYYYREYRTGLAIEIPAGHVGLIFPRSSQSNVAQSLSNCVGVVDHGFSGEIIFRFKFDSGVLALKGVTAGKSYRKGERVGQLIVMPIPSVEIVEVDELSESERGTKGFGSSGK